MTDDREPAPIPPESPAYSTKEKAKLATGAGLLVLFVLFVVINTDQTEVDFLVTSVDLPLVVVLLVTAILGGAMTELLRYQRNRRR